MLHPMAAAGVATHRELHNPLETRCHSVQTLLLEVGAASKNTAFGNCRFTWKRSAIACDYCVYNSVLVCNAAKPMFVFA